MNSARWRWLAPLLVLLIAPALRADPPESINLRRTIVVQVVAQTKAAVVNISASKLITKRVNPFGNDPFFQQFDIGQEMQVPANSLGSGFLIHADGYVVTNNHVIDRARQITVELDDGRKLPARLISADPEADLALLKITDKNPFPTLALGDSDDLLIGEPAIAIGNPLGYSHSVSTGIVSAINRDLKDDQDQTVLSNLIQTDAAINPGNSGGPLLNAYGQVIGINTAIRSDAQNIGFAIPINRLRDLIPELMNPSQVEKLDVPIKLAEQRQITEPAQIVTRIVTDEVPPRIVHSIGGVVPANIVDAYDLLLTAKNGQPLKIEFEGGQSQDFIPRPTPLPDAIVQAKQKLGLTVEPMTPVLADKYHLNEEDGIFVDAVAQDSVAGRAGVQPGDILVQIGRFRISTLDDFAALLDRLPTTGEVRIGVIRDDQLDVGLLEFGQ
ncbi:MAG: trypsin-like peptidase domain-containing protein [Tepidisphaeraceae bacterium]|jgi:serine protease Do